MFILALVSFPDEWDGFVLNPFLALLKVLLPALSLLMLVECIYQVIRMFRGLSQTSLSSAVVTGFLERWNQKESERQRHYKEKGEDNGE